jgi:DNA-binding NtrC family response regulator
MVHVRSGLPENLVESELFGHRNKPAAAAELGISLKTMCNKLNQLQEDRKTAG